MNILTHAACVDGTHTINVRIVMRVDAIGRTELIKCAIVLLIVNPALIIVDTALL